MKEWQEYFFFNKRERRALYVLLSFILISLAVRLFIKQNRSTYHQLSLNNEQFQQAIDSFYKSIQVTQQNTLIDSGRSKQKKDTIYLNTERFKARRVFSVIELNTADTTLLEMLPFIGKKLSKRIIYYREKLGGFYSPRQLYEVYGIDTSRLNVILPRVTVDTAYIRKIPINKADYSLLVAHPYIDKNIAKKILLLRRSNQKIKEISQLKNVIDPLVWNKLQHYIMLDEDE